ncbi:transposase [Sporocytophaga myxococcoides]|uniref:Transposase n=1 Tax=Sporocytophaga myxococcoides TaxID=153721 RepID=A0A098LLN5_9BACT|nr:transposase [Sporocytophaga myxococcoides]
MAYNTLFEAAWETIQTFGYDHKLLGAKTGMISILHTWGQTLSLHPHLHCIVPGGGINGSGKWKSAKSKGKYLFPVKAMSKVFRGKFLAYLKNNYSPDKALINALYKKDWVVYTKQPFANNNTVIEYLGRYTHKIAISNHRIKNISKDSVTFTYKDYRQDDVKKEMTLNSMEFVRRFALHVLPKRFVRIRHFGILSSSSKKESIPTIKEQLSCMVSRTRPPRILTIYDPLLCPCCKTKTMIVKEVFNRRGPPVKIFFEKTVIV